MKKTICVLLACLLLLLTSCSSCGGTYNAYELYETARMSYTAGFEASVSFRMTMGDQTSTGNVLIKTAGDNTSMIREDSTDERHFVDGVAYRRGYVVGGTRYQDTEDQLARVMTTSTKEEFKAENSSFFMLSPYAEAFPVFTQEQLKNVKVESGDGQRFFAAEITADAVRTYLGDASIPEAAGILAATFDNAGNMLQMILRLDLSEDGGETIKSFEIIYTFQNIGTIPTVQAPSESYIDISP